MDRVVNTPPDFGTMPATLRSLAEACLAKDPRDRPMAGDLLAHVGAIQSEPGWMAELAFAGYAAGEQPVSSVAPADSPVPFGAADAVLPAALASGQTASRRRWRRSRSLIPAYVTGGLVVVSAVAVLALTKPAVTPVAHAQGRPSAAATTPHPSASAKPRPSATPTTRPWPRRSCTCRQSARLRCPCRPSRPPSPRRRRVRARPSWRPRRRPRRRRRRSPQPSPPAAAVAVPQHSSPSSSPAPTKTSSTATAPATSTTPAL